MALSEETVSGIVYQKVTPNARCHYIDGLRFGHQLTDQRICHPYEGCNVESAGTVQDPGA